MTQGTPAAVTCPKAWGGEGGGSTQRLGSRSHGMPRDSLFLIKTKQANSQTQRVSSPSARGRKPREPLGVTTIQLARLPPMHGHCPLLGPCLGQSSPPPPALPRLSRYFHHFLIFFCFRSSILAKPSPGEATSPSHHVCLGKGDTLAWLVPPCPHPPSDGDRGGQDHPPTAPDPPHPPAFATAGRESPGAGKDGHDGTWKASSSPHGG